MEDSEPKGEPDERAEVRSPSPRRLPLQPILLSVLAIIVGALAAYGTSGYRLAFDWVTHWLYGGGIQTAPPFETVPAWKLIAALTAGGLVIGLVPVLLRMKRYEGPADVIVANHENRGRLPVKAGIAVADFLGGIHLATGVLAALYEREQTGDADRNCRPDRGRLDANVPHAARVGEPRIQDGGARSVGAPRIPSGCLVKGLVRCE